MEKIEIKWLEKQSGFLCQIYSSGVEYCFISDDMKQCHDFVLCKDFLQDAVQAHLHNKQNSIYGFSYNSKNKPALCTKRTRIAIANQSDKAFLSRVPNIINFINQFAKKLHLKPTKAFEVSNPPKKYKSGVILTEGSQRWMNSPPLLSMYSLLLRCGAYHTVGQDCMDTVDGIIKGKVKSYGSADRQQLASGLKGIKDILSLGYRPFFYIDDKKNYPPGVGVSSMHNSSGIGAFSGGYSKQICRYWHRKSIVERLKEKEKGK